MQEKSKQILSEHSVSITNPRILVLEELLEIKSPITVDDLQKKLKNKVAKSTLYRVLNDLKTINILNEFTSPDNTVVVELVLEGDQHHHHLFCSDCGEIIDVELSKNFESLLDNFGGPPIAFHIIVQGFLKYFLDLFLGRKFSINLSQL